MVMLQGNTCWLAVRVEDCEGKVVGGDRVARGRFEVGGIVKYYGEGGEVVWDEQVGAFLFPLSEEETFTLSGDIEYQARVVLEDGTVCGSVPEGYYVYGSLSKELIGDGGYGTQDGVVLSAKLVNYVQGGGSGGTTDYNALNNKPSINGVELKGNKTTEELGIVSKETDPTVPEYVKAITEQDITEWNGKVGQEQINGVYESITGLGIGKADISYVEQVESIAKGANQALSFTNYQKMVEKFLQEQIDTYNIGQNVLIETLNVPDLWISEILPLYVPYTYTTDEDFVNQLKTNGRVQVGFYIFSALETQKVDLTDYVKNTDYASSSKAGLVIAKTDNGIGVSATGDYAGQIFIVPATTSQIDEKTNTRNPITPSVLDYAVNSVLKERITATQLDDGSYSLTINTEV